MTFPLNIVLLGTSVTFDIAAAVMFAIVALLLASLAVSSRLSLRDSRGAGIALGFIALGAITQCLASEMLLFLTGGAVAGYAVLALSLAGPRPLAASHALAGAILLVVGDLALLELLMLLAKITPQLGYADAGIALEQSSTDFLARFCLVLGFGCRLALVALCVPEGRSSPANVALLPGWLLLGMCAGYGLIRLSCAGGFGWDCSVPTLGLLWWVPVIAVVTWQLPGWVPRLIRSLSRGGHWYGQ